MNVLKLPHYRRTSEDSSVAPTVPSEAPRLEPMQPELPQDEGAAPEGAAEEPVAEPIVSVEERGARLRQFAHMTLVTLKGTGYALWLLVRTCIRYLVRHPLHATFNAAMLGVLALTVVTGSEIHHQMILGKISDQTVDRIIKGSRFTRNFDFNGAAREGGREFLRVGAPVWAQREGVRAILYAARKAGLDIEHQAVLLAIADIESGFNPMARAATTSACGLFQFVKRTGEMFNLAQSDCMDPIQNARAGVDHYLYNYERRVAAQVQNLTGNERLFRTFELSYYLHHDGPDSSNPANDVKATILDGSHVLFRAYSALLEEEVSQEHAPTFAERFEANMWKTFDKIASLFGSQASAMEKVSEVRSEDVAAAG